MRQEVNTSPLPSGAGRKYSFAWGNYGVGAQNNDPVSTNTTQRPQGSADNLWTLTVTGAPPATRGMSQKNGRAATRYTSNTGTGYEVYPNNGTRFQMVFQTQKAPFSLQGIDDFWCWSVSAILAFDAIPGAVTGDLGLVLGVGVNLNKPTRGRIISGNFAGIMVGPTNTGVTGVRIRQTDGAGLSFSQNTPTQPDQTQFNKYEIRLVGPTADGEARVKIFINNVQQFSLSYGAGTVLPDQTGIATVALGFAPALENFQACGAPTATMWVPPFGLQIAAAPTEQMLSASST